MTNKEAIRIIREIQYPVNGDNIAERDSAIEMAIKALEQETNTKSLGEDLRICQKSITDDKVLIGFNMAVALCNKYFAGSEVQE